MIESVRYTWLLLKDEPLYVPPILLLIGTVVISWYFVQIMFTPWWGKILCLMMAFLLCYFLIVGAIEPESTYKDIQKKKESIIYTLKNCRVSAFEAQQAGLIGTTKDAWSCPDGVTRYLPVKYRDKGRQYHE